MSDENASPIVKATLLEDGTLLHLVMDKPKGNILSLEMMQALSKELNAQKDNPHLRAVIIRGAGKHFSFGASVEERLKNMERNHQEVKGRINGLILLIVALVAEVILRLF